MKIIILGTAYPYRGGIADFNTRLAKELQNGGHTVLVWTFTLQYPAFLFPGKTQYSTDPAPQFLDITRKVNSINPLNWIKVGKELKREAADLMIVPFWLPFLSPCLGSISRLKGKRTRVVSILHNMIPHEHRPGDRAFARYFCNSVDGFVSLSQAVLEETRELDKKGKPMALRRHPLYDHFGEKCSREKALEYLHLPSECRYMLFFGLIRDYKGLDLLMRAYADSRFRKSGIKLLVAGEFYGGGEKYMELEEELGLKGEIIWRSEFIPSSDVRYCFSASDLVVQPYKTASQSGITQIAYHFEVPMVVTDVGGLSEIVPNGKAGYVVKPEPARIADAVLHFFKNGNRHSFSEGIKEEKLKYSWSSLTQGIMEVYSAIQRRR